MAKQSLASTLPQTQASNVPAKIGEFQLPAIFGTPQAMELTPRFNSPYLVFSQPSAKQQWLDFVKRFPDIEDGDPVIVMPTGEMIRPSPLRFTILAAVQYWAARDAAKGGVETDRYKVKKSGTVERIFAAIIIYLPDRALPATVVGKSVKCEAFHTISKEISAAATPEWSKQGPTFEMALAACSAPFARVVGTISISGRTGRDSGQSYRLAKATCAPSGPAEWRMLADLQTKEGAKALKDVAEGYQSRLTELDIK